MAGAGPGSARGARALFDASAEHTENRRAAPDPRVGVSLLAEAAAMHGRASRERAQRGTFATANGAAGMRAT
jgi:hypothetical protein